MKEPGGDFSQVMEPLLTIQTWNQFLGGLPLYLAI
jgi:hypothetical protein